MPQINNPNPNDGLAGGAFLKGLSEAPGLIESATKNKLYQAQLAKDELSNQQAQLTLQNNQNLTKSLLDPNSPETKTTKQLANTYLSGLDTTGLFKSNPKSLTELASQINDPKMSGLQIHQLFETSPVMKAITSLGEAQSKANVMLPLAQAKMEGVANQKDRIAASAADHFDKDPILTKINKQKQQVDLDKHTLETADVLTPQIINEVQQGIANAISGGGSAGLGKTEQTEIQTAKQKLAELQTRFTSDPTPVKDPQLIQYFHGVLNRLGDAYDRNGYQRAQQIFNGRSKGYRNNPDAIQVMQDKLESYSPSAPMTPAGNQNSSVPVDADLTKMNPQQLQEYIRTHGG